MPRYYTIASSALVHPNEISIAISLSKFDAPDGSNRFGLTSGYLKNIKESGKDEIAKIFVKDSNFDMRNDVPLLMVGPGTGIVPFIAFF